MTQGKVVIPVLVGGATMPAPVHLPGSIQRLTHLQAASLDDRHWDADLSQLVTRVQELVPELRLLSARGATAGQTTAPAASETPVQVLREIAQRVLEESLQHRPRPMPPRAPGLRLSWVWVLLRPLLRKLRRLLTIVMAIALVYIGIRLFGDDNLLRQLDALEGRLMIGWRRLLGYLGTLAPG